MKKIIGITLLGGLLILAGFFLGTNNSSWFDETVSESSEQERKIEYWVAPMDPKLPP